MKMKGGCALYLAAAIMWIISIVLVVEVIGMIWEWLQTLDLPIGLRMILFQ